MAVALFVCLFAMGVSATTVYKDEGGTELFSCEIFSSHHIDTYEIKNGGFAKVDSDGDALTWYLVSTEADGENIIKVVKAVKTKDVFENGAYKNGVDKNKVVSANFENDVDKLPAYGAFSGNYNKELLFIYIPDAVKTLPYRFCQNVPVILCEFSENSLCESWDKLIFWGARSLRELFIPKYFTKFPQSADGEFTGCERLEKLTFHKESTLSEWPQWYFGGTRIKEIRVPDSITYLNSRAFQGMGHLETVYLSPNLTHIYKNSNNHSLFHDCSSLKTVYIPKGLVADNLIDNYGGGFDYSFSSGSGVTFVYTGTLEDFLAIKEKICKSSNNRQLYDATVENGRIVIADHCETFFGSHSWSGSNSVIANNGDMVDYFKEIGIGDSCEKCGKSETKSTIAPLFVSVGLSAKSFGVEKGIVQGYIVNKAAIDAYTLIVPEFSFGIVACGNEGGEAISPIPGQGGAIDVSFDNLKNEFIDVKVTGILENHYDSKIVFCIYAKENGKIYYLDNGITSLQVVGSSYNDIEQIM